MAERSSKNTTESYAEKVLRAAAALHIASGIKYDTPSHYVAYSPGMLQRLGRNSDWLSNPERIKESYNTVFERCCCIY